MIYKQLTREEFDNLVKELKEKSKKEQKRDWIVYPEFNKVMNKVVEEYVNKKHNIAENR